MSVGRIALPHNISATTLEKLRDFMSRQLGMSLDPSIEAFGADLENHLLKLMFAATVKMSAMARVIESKEKVAAHHQAQLAELAEARNTLESERQANTELTEENEHLRDRMERLRGLCKWASGRLLEANDIAGAEKVMELAGDKEPAKGLGAGSGR